MLISFLKQRSVLRTALVALVALSAPQTADAGIIRIFRGAEKNFVESAQGKLKSLPIVGGFYDKIVAKIPFASEIIEVVGFCSSRRQ